MELPELTQQPILYIDGTPNADYPIRILRAYRENCNCIWADTTEGKGSENPMLKMMNEHNEQRAKLLDKAIALLEK